jgi:4-amino-4-deoxy-L-arabinose transferase-like glycosyltransferase
MRLMLVSLVLCAGLLTSPWRGHVDDTDAQLYQVVARNMARDGRWLDPSYLPSIYPHYREHLPFGFWPMALLVRLFGEGALPVLGLVWSLATLALVGWLGWRLLGPWSAVCAVLVLGVTETFFVYGARPRLDPPLLFFSTAAAALVLNKPGQIRSWLLGAALGAVACLIKGPFGLLPLVAATGACAIVERSTKPLLLGAFATLLAAIPGALFVWVDHIAGSGSWWEGYGRSQLLASVIRGRTDGSTSAFYPLVSLAGRFWPGLPLVALGFFRAARPAASDSKERTAATRLIALFSILLVLELVLLPGRKWWNHALIAYPALALLAGAGAGAFLPQLSRARAAVTLVALAAIAWGMSVAGFAAKLLPKPCVVSTEFAAPLSEAAPHEPILLVSSPTNWRMIAALAAERGLFPEPAESFSPTEQSGTHARLALLQEKLFVPTRPPWQELARARGWVLLRQH